MMAEQEPEQRSVFTVVVSKRTADRLRSIAGKLRNSGEKKATLNYYICALIELCIDRELPYLNQYDAEALRNMLEELRMGKPLSKSIV